ncbi:MAG: Ca-activated chloride channel family protein [Arenicella sp.]|jgi:Ca-activated chloride channel family protein
MDPSIRLEMFQQFHFIRPEWLWGVPLAVLLWLALRNQRGGQQWSSHIPKEMLAALQIGTVKQSNLWKWALLAMWLGTIVAAAGPTWDKQASPTLQNQQALVLILDLSPSMLAQDLSPDRLSRAKYKLIDVLRQQADGQVALIAYAGDAHTVSPLTDDPNTIQALLPALHPTIMPSRGSNTEAAIELAQQLMLDAGLNSGDILLISDGVAEDAIETITNDIDSNYRLSVLAVGGSSAAPVPAANGGFLRRANGEIILSAVNGGALRSMATGLGGRYSMITADDTDIQTLLVDQYEAADNADQAQQTSVVYDAWVDMGHWLVLLILPLALILFRKGAIYLVPLCLPLLLLSPSDAYAQSSTPTENVWNDLWQTRDQQASKQFAAGDFDLAGKTFERKDWSALSSYNNGDYQQAIDSLEGLNDLTSLYNKANALALNDQLQEAIDTYQQVLDQQPEHADAKSNKSVVEELLQQQDKSEEDGSGESEPNEDESGEGDSSEDKSKQGESNQGESDQGEADKGESNEDESNQDESDQDTQDGEPQDRPSDVDPEDSDENSSKSSPEDKQDDETNAEGLSQDEPQSEANQGLAKQGAAQIEETDEPLQDSSEQWLRTIADDPSGLLRRKFDYQARQRVQQTQRQKSDKAPQQRY